MRKPDNMSLVQVRAFEECSDLIENGYHVVFSAVTMDSWVIKLRHHFNGRTLKMTCTKNHWFLTDSDKTLKFYPIQIEK